MQIALGQVIIIMVIRLHSNHSKICILYINVVAINIQNGEERQ